MGTRTVPLGVPALLGVAGPVAVFAAGAQTWQLFVSVVLASSWSASTPPCVELS